MTEELIIAGFGGQGVLSMGKILAYAAMKQNKNVSWMPSYGPEMRGGTANVTVIVSDELVSSPILRNYDTAILLNQQALDKFEPFVRKSGILIYDNNGIIRHPERNDIKIYAIEAGKEAIKFGSLKTYNMIMLGAYLKIKPIVDISFVIQALTETLPKRYHHLISENEKALKKGQELIEILQPNVMD